MPALSISERADFDNTIYPAVGYVYISQPELVFEAPLNGVFYSNDAIVALDYGTPTTGAYTDIEPEMTVEIWANDANLYGSQRIRKAATTDAIFVGRSPEGTHPGELSYIAGSTIRVYKERRVWAKNPFIANDGTQYKDELAYPGDDESQPPVANAGPDLLIISNTGSEDVSLDALGTIPSFAVRNGASLDTYLWDLDDGTTSDSLSDSAITATFGYGERYISLTVTDDNGVAHTCYKYIVVARVSDCIPAKITRESIRANGVSLALEIDASQISAASRPNAKVLYGTDTTHGAMGSKQLIFSGWLAPEQWQLADAKSQRRTVTIECHDIAARLRNLYGFPLSVSNQSSETGWYRMPNATIDRLTHHYLQWHTNILALADFSWSGQGSTYPLPEFTTSGASIWEQSDRLARAIGYRLTCNTSGQLQIKGDPLVLPTSDQATDYSLPTQRTSTEVTTLTESDYGEYSFTANQPTQYFWVRSSAVVASVTVGDISDVRCSAPGKTPAQGVSSVEETELLVTTQDELNVRAGNDYASRKAPSFSTFTFKMVKTKQVFEPANAEWVRITLPSEERSRYPFLSNSGNRFLITEIVNTYDHKKMKRTSTLTAEIEVEGIPAQTIVDPPQQIDQFPSYQWDLDYVPVLPSISFGNAATGLVAGSGNLVLILDDGTVAVTTNFDTPSWEGGPSWVVYDHSATLGSTVLQWCYRANGTNIEGWIVTPSSIYKAVQLQNASPTLTLQHSFGYSNNTHAIDADYIFSPGQFVVVVSAHATNAGVAIYSLDGGSTWSSEVSLGTEDVSGVFQVKVSTQQHGKVYTACGNATITQIGKLGHYLKESNNFGQTWSTNTNVYADDARMPGLNMQAFDESTVFYGYNVLLGAQPNRLYRASRTSQNLVDIAPEVSGTPYGPVNNARRAQIGIADNDKNKVVFVGSNGALTSFGVFITPNAMSSVPSWTSLVEPSSSVLYRGCAFVDNGNGLYLFGNEGAIAYSPSPYQPGDLDDRTGNLTTLASVVGIAGF